MINLLKGEIMTKIFILTDVHGNYECMKILKNKIDEIKPDFVFSAGDLIGIGPSHNEVLEIVTKIANFYTVRGNHEGYYIDGFHNPSAALEQEFHTWVKNTMEPKYDNYIKNLPIIRHFSIENKNIVLIHYARTNNKFTTIENNLTIEHIEKLFNSIDADIIIYGHDHTGFIHIGNKSFINIGTAGCNNLNIGKTKYGILTLDNNSINIEVNYLDYDITPEIEKMEKLNVPDKELIKKVFFKKK